MDIIIISAATCCRLIHHHLPQDRIRVTDCVYYSTGMYFVIVLDADCPRQFRLAIVPLVFYGP